MRQEPVSTTPTTGRSWLRKLLTMAMVVATMMTAMTLSSAPQADAAQSCFGDTKTSLSDARKSFKKKCGEDWNAYSGRHKCNWSVNGWRCFGPDRSDGSKGHCVGHAAKPTRAVAIASFEKLCQEKWDGSSGYHRCSWSKTRTYQGWQCTRRGR